MQKLFLNMVMNVNDINKHEGHDVFYYLSTNEDGWRCMTCNEELGFRPDLDRELILGKVSGILTDLHTGNFVHISNSTEGEYIHLDVVKECKSTGCYDQHFIVLSIMSNPNLISHVEYWRKESEKWI